MEGRSHLSRVANAMPADGVSSCDLDLVIPEYSDLSARRVDYVFVFLNPSPLVPHLCNASVNWVSIGSGNGLSPARCQAITRTNAVSLSIEPLGTKFSKIQIKIHDFSLMKMYLKRSSAK